MKMSQIVSKGVWALCVGVGCSFEPPVGRFEEPGQDLGVAEMGGDLRVEDAGREEGSDQALDQGVDLEAPDFLVGEDLGDFFVDEDLVELDQGLTECGGAVVDVMTDEAHCGRCDNACDAVFGECVGGVCGCSGEGMQVCGGRCVDVLWDPLHCGGCGQAVGPAGACVRGERRCRPGYTLCGGACVDTQSDPAHCGRCDRSCEGKACKDGACRSGDGCDIGWGRCGKPGGVACLQNMTHDLHCRGALDFGCGSVCDGDEVCRRGGVFEPPRCRSVRLGLGCERCPCAACVDGERCEYAPGAVSRVWCVD